MNAERPKQWYRYCKKKTGIQGGKWGLPIMNHKPIFPQIMIAYLLAFHESHFELTTRKKQSSQITRLKWHLVLI